MLPNLNVLLVLVLAADLSATVAAQQSETLLIGPGDLVHIHVLDTPELDQAARVTDAGTMPLTVGGEVTVISDTPAQAARAIEKALLNGRFLLHPHVMVTVLP